MTKGISIFVRFYISSYRSIYWDSLLTLGLYRARLVKTSIPTVQPADLVVMLLMCSVAQTSIQLLYFKGKPLYLWAPRSPRILLVRNRSCLL